MSYTLTFCSINTVSPHYGSTSFKSAFWSWYTSRGYIKNIYEFTQRLILWYNSQFPDPPKVFLKLLIERWKIHRVLLLSIITITTTTTTTTTTTDKPNPKLNLLQYHKISGSKWSCFEIYWNIFLRTGKHRLVCGRTLRKS